MRLRITHKTEYSYDQPVSYALERVRLHPQSSRVQTVEAWSLTLEGAMIAASYDDHHRNHTDLVQVTPGTQRVVLTASGTVTTHDGLGIYGAHEGGGPLWYFQEPTDLTRPGALLQALAAPMPAAQSLQISDLHALSAAILAAAPYQTGATYADTTAEAALEGGAGVCQDHAHMFVAAARLAGLPARYVSGYLMLDDQVEQDASHAWAEAHFDGMGWVGFDVSNQISPDERYVRIAIGRDARDAAPVTGMRIGAATESMMVSLQVQQ